MGGGGGGGGGGLGPYPQGAAAPMYTPYAPEGESVASGPPDRYDYKAYPKEFVERVIRLTGNDELGFALQVNNRVSAQQRFEDLLLNGPCDPAKYYRRVRKLYDEFKSY